MTYSELAHTHALAYPAQSNACLYKSACMQALVDLSQHHSYLWFHSNTIHTVRVMQALVDPPQHHTHLRISDPSPCLWCHPQPLVGQADELDSCELVPSGRLGTRFSVVGGVPGLIAGVGNG